jgi:hypothetical protein
MVDPSPGVVALLEADIEDGERPVLILCADLRSPETFGERLPT